MWPKCTVVLNRAVLVPVSAVGGHSWRMAPSQSGRENCERTRWARTQCGADDARVPWPGLVIKAVTARAPAVPADSDHRRGGRLAWRGWRQLSGSGLARSIDAGRFELAGPVVLRFVLAVFLMEQARPAVRRRLLARGHLVDMGYLLVYALAVVPLIVLIGAGFSAELARHAPWLVIPRIPGVPSGASSRWRCWPAIPVLAISSNATTSATIFTIYASLGALPHASVRWLLVCCGLIHLHLWDIAYRDAPTLGPAIPRAGVLGPGDRRRGAPVGAQLRDLRPAAPGSLPARRRRRRVADRGGERDVREDGLVVRELHGPIEVRARRGR